MHHLTEMLTACKLGKAELLSSRVSFREDLRYSGFIME